MTVPSALLCRASCGQWKGYSRRLARRYQCNATPRVESPEPRTLLATIAEYPTPASSPAVGNGLVASR